jgi:hypothetical protein
MRFASLVLLGCFVLGLLLVLKLGLQVTAVQLSLVLWFVANLLALAVLTAMPLAPRHE